MRLHFIISLILFYALGCKAQRYDYFLENRPCKWVGDSIIPNANLNLQGYETPNLEGHIVGNADGSIALYVIPLLFENDFVKLRIYNSEMSLIDVIEVRDLHPSDYSSNSIYLLHKGDNLFYLFVSGGYKGQHGDLQYEKGLSYFIIDATKNAENVSDEVELNYTDDNTLSFTWHRNKKDVWLVTQRLDSLYAYLIDSEGINSPIATSIDGFNQYVNTAITSRFSKSGKTFALRYVKSHNLSSNQDNFIDFFTFNQETGEFIRTGNTFKYNNLSQIVDGIRYYAIQDFTFLNNFEDKLVLGAVNSNLTSGSKDHINSLLLYDLDSDKARNIKMTPSRRLESFYELSNFHFSPNGKLMFSAWSSHTEGNDYLHGYLDKDYVSGDIINIETYTIEGDIENGTIKGGYLTRNIRVYGHTQQGLHRYANLGFTSEQTCDSILLLRQNADTTFFRHYVWVINKTDTLVGDAVRLKLTETRTKSVKLIAYTEKGYSRWFLDTVSISFKHFKPHAQISLRDSQTCQWSFTTIRDLSRVEFKGRPITYRFIYGDGTDSMFSYSSIEDIPSETHKIFNTIGSFPILLEVNDGYCTDILDSTSQIKVIPAPRPGMILSDTGGCTPLQISVKMKYLSDVDSAVYIWGNSDRSLSFSGEDEHTFNENTTGSDQVKIYQLLYGSTGCVSIDSSFIHVRQSFNSSDLVVIKKVTVEDNRIKVKWDKLDYTRKYLIYRNDEMIDSTLDLEYIDERAEVTDKNTYVVVAENLCGAYSNRSEASNNIVLNGQMGNDNSRVELLWNIDSNWSTDLVDHKVGRSDADLLWRMCGFGDRSFTDFIIPDEKLGLNYRIEANNLNTGEQSYSNVIFVPYNPTIFVPNSFTPNGDGINDYFKPIVLGVKNYRLTIYNFWGEKVFDEENSYWDGTIDGEEATQGTYSVLIRAKTNSDKWEYLNEIVYLLR